MLIRNRRPIGSSEITPRSLYLNRREFLASAAGVLGAATLTTPANAAGAKLQVTTRLVTTTDAQTPYSAATTFNNFYEFGSAKDSPVKNSKAFQPKPWSVSVEGLCAKPGTYSLADLVRPHALEERVYRMRCVEGWSMVIPWVGFPLADLLKRFEPGPNAAFVEFTSIVRPSEMPAQRERLFPLLTWPYKEGLRLDEAMHPLAILAVGLYGEELPNQNGAPLRLVVPWKYGFKGIKSIVRIRFVEKQPVTSWMLQEPSLYSFYSNVNPGRTNSIYRDQSTERRIGEFFMRKTLMFNGYDEVAPLYQGMNLARSF
jgi:sulfoxide reductase catalytic subunit YedY